MKHFITLKFISTLFSYVQDSPMMYKRKLRKKKVFYYNPPFNNCIKTNKGTESLKLVSRYYPKSGFYSTWGCQKTWNPWESWNLTIYVEKLEFEKLKKKEKSGTLNNFYMLSKHFWFNTNNLSKRVAKKLENLEKPGIWQFRLKNSEKPEF